MEFPKSTTYVTIEALSKWFNFRVRHQNIIALEAIDGDDCTAVGGKVYQFLLL